MKENKVAEVLNMGMKGTYIKIINPLLEVHNV
jgi:GTP-sensing pleiotropic transcriptional regulator CodY